MAIKNIVKIWDDRKILEENINFLKTKTKPVTFPASDYIKNIIQDLIDTYQKISCVGIAANQIGYEYQIFIGMKEIKTEKEAEEIEKKEALEKYGAEGSGKNLPFSSLSEDLKKKDKNKFGMNCYFVEIVQMGK